MTTTDLRERMEYYGAMIRYAEKQRDDIKRVLDIEADEKLKALISWIRDTRGDNS
jgi:hypothetical protein